jgi:uncharacterized protein YecT (DUF1311 family)
MLAQSPTTTLKVSSMKLTIAACALLLCAQAHSASFDCAKASTRAEKAICADPKLSQLDTDVAAAYGAAGASLDDAMRKRLARSQREWLLSRNSPSNLAADMRLRLRQLQQATVTINGVRFLQLAGDKRPMFVLSASPGASAYNQWADSVWESNSHDTSPRAAEAAQAKCQAESPKTDGDDCVTESEIHAYSTSVPGPDMVSVYEWRSIDELGSAHPMNETHHYNWWLSRIGRITGGDMFASDAYKAVIARGVQRWVKANGGEATPEAIASVSELDAWGLSADGMHLSGDGYTFAVGRGEVEIVIAWSEFGVALRPEFAAALRAR